MNYKVPILMITWNRLEYTKKALKALCLCEGVIPMVIDNGSTDGTKQWLEQLHGVTIIYNGSNLGIAFAMNQFLSFTEDYDVVGKIDNDTIVKPDWCERMLPYLKFADIIQSKHHIIPATCPGGWNAFVRHMPYKNGVYYHTFVGGSGILFNRKLVNQIPITENKIMGWREFQRFTPKIAKAFVQDVEIQLLDEHGYTDYPEYYKETGRV